MASREKCQRWLFHGQRLADNLTGNLWLVGVSRENKHMYIVSNVSNPHTTCWDIDEQVTR